MAKGSKSIPVVNMPPIQVVLKPFQKFFSTQASGGIILLICAVIAIAWANSPWSESYFALWHYHLKIGVEGFMIDKPLELWINDGLMAIFFYVVGLEIKRELVVGELSSIKQAMLPISAAFGGMVVPALIFVAFNYGTETITGWGIPMATDIAFALGILALLGDKVPIALKVFLTALAIVDDLGAVLVIAVFYTTDISMIALLMGGGFLLLSIICNKLHVRSPIVYTIIGIALWVAFLKSGVHATIAGVLLAFTIPGKARINSNSFVKRSKELITNLESSPDLGDDVPVTKEFNSTVFELESNCEKVQAPMLRLEHLLAPWVAFFIMPVFALANAGLKIEPELLAVLINPISMGIMLGLIFGKQIGVTLFSWLSIKFGFSEMPNDVSWKQLYGVSCLAGIGFTMSLFISNLAYTNDLFVQESKLGILLASLVAGIWGMLILREKKAKKAALSDS